MEGDVGWGWVGVGVGSGSGSGWCVCVREEEGEGGEKGGEERRGLDFSVLFNRP